jgi:hypothetical protein
VAPEETTFNNDFQSAGDGPQGLKPNSLTFPNGTAEAVPFPVLSPRSNLTLNLFSNPGPNSHATLAETGTALVLRVFRPLLAAAVTLRDGKPACIVCSARRELQGQVMWCSGPWRTSGNWWGDASWMRDEWDVALYGTSSIGLCRLCHDLANGQWFIEGTYD